MLMLTYIFQSLKMLNTSLKEPTIPWLDSIKIVLLELTATWVIYKYTIIGVNLIIQFSVTKCTL